ncbi:MULTISPECIES: hypothetical protein [Bacteria]
MARTPLSSSSYITLQIVLIVAGVLLTFLAISEFMGGDAGVSAWINIVLWPVLIVASIVNIVVNRSRAKN